ncbi:MAG: AMP-binding protein [Hyphomicrobiaceae bacterium]
MSGDPATSGINPFAGRDINWLLDLRAATRRDHPFLIWEPFEGEREVWTYGRFHDRVQRVAAGLAGRGLKAGDTLLVHLDNSPEMEFLWFATARLGVVIVTTNTRSSADEMAYFAEHCGAVAAVTQPELASLLSAAAPQLEWIAVTERLAGGGCPPAGQLPGRDARFSTLDGHPAGLPRLAPDPWRLSSVQYTSGTTSRPKGVLWTHGNALWGARTCAVHEALTQDDVHHVVLPTFHTNARAYSILATLWVGGSFVLQPRFSASRFWAAARRNRATWHSTVPFCLKALAAHEVPGDHSFRMWGTSANQPSFAAAFNIPTIGWWGMTETISHGIIGDALLPNPPNTTGRPAAGYGIRILRADRTHVEPGETGHLECRGRPGIELFLEYLNAPEATAASFTDDGWFITGDRVTLGTGGTITFSDRDKDMLKIGGENVAASEIERVVATVQGVGECAVVAQKHRMLDEVPVVFVIPLQGLAAELREDLGARIVAQCRARLADFKVPRQVLVVDDLPRVTLEKVHKAELRRRLPIAE